MNLVSLKKAFIDLYTNSLGWRTNRKLVVIESDDWGSIRMPSREVYEKFLALGFSMEKLPYLKYDSLESNSDLEALFKVLDSVRDFKGNHPVITANVIMTNPDFDRIRESGFKDYYYELFTETLKRYPEHDRVMELYREGISKNIFFPQLHGREHLNIQRWMGALKYENGNARLAFENGFFDLATDHTNISQDSFVDALSLNDIAEFNEQISSITESVKLFEQVFGYSSITFIAPCYIWRPEMEDTFYASGLKMLQGGAYQLVPEIGKVNAFHKRLHFTGQKSKSKVIFSVRNCFFEPSSRNHNHDEIASCILQIDKAFKNKKPAVITSHRLNYIGFIDKSNREKNLELLTNLLKNIVLRWPDVEFISSARLYDLMQ